MDETKQKEWLTMAEAAEYLGVSYPRFSIKVKEGVYPVSKVPGFGNMRRVSRTTLDRMMRENEAAVNGGSVGEDDQSR